MKTSSNELLDGLLGSVKFEELTPENQQMVLQDMSQETFDLYRKMVMESTDVLKPPAGMPSGSLNEIKLDLGKNLSPDLTFSQRVFNAKMPIWLAVLMGLFGFGLYQLMQNEDVQMEESIVAEHIIMLDTVLVQAIDTIYIETPSKPKVIIREVFKTIELPKVMPMAVTKEVQDFKQIIPENQKAYYADLETVELLAGRPGKSVEEEDELMDLLDLDED